MLLLLYQGTIIASITKHEFIVRSHFHNLSTGYNNNDIRITDGSEAVCNNDGGALFGCEELVEGFLYNKF